MATWSGTHPERTSSLDSRSLVRAGILEIEGHLTVTLPETVQATAASLAPALAPG